MIIDVHEDCYGLGRPSWFFRLVTGLPTTTQTLITIAKRFRQPKSQTLVHSARNSQPPCTESTTYLDHPDLFPDLFPPSDSVRVASRRIRPGAAGGPLPSNVASHDLRAEVSTVEGHQLIGEVGDRHHARRNADHVRNAQLGYQ